MAKLWKGIKSSQTELNPKLTADISLVPRYICDSSSLFFMSLYIGNHTSDDFIMFTSLQRVCPT